MLFDNIILTAGSTIQGLSYDSGVTLPVSPTDGQNFRLTATDGAYTPGQYWYDATNTTWVSGDISAVTAGTGLTGGGARGAVTLALDSTYMATVYATKEYADAIAQGLDPKASVRVMTTADITLSGTQTIDGVAVVAGDRVLVKNQTTGSQNGIYVVATGAWARSVDADTSAKVTTGMYTFVEDGTVGGGSGMNLITKAPITLGTTALVFSQFNAATSYTAGTNVSIVGSVISVPNANIPYDIGGAILGKPSAAAVVLRTIAVRSFTIPAGMTGSLAKAAIAATASTVLSVQKNGTQFGTITFAVSGTTGTFAAASSTSFAAGDLITIVAPGVQDSTFADCAITLVGTLV